MLNKRRSGSYAPTPFLIFKAISYSSSPSFSARWSIHIALRGFAYKPLLAHKLLKVAQKVLQMLAYGKIQANQERS
jgi:hypothetical protein